MHLRMPSIDQGVQAFVWAFVFFLILFVGAVLLDFATGTSLLVSILVALAVFLLVRLRGGDYPGPR
jgi:flagellar biosynthesis component FlhA